MNKYLDAQDLISSYNKSSSAQEKIDNEAFAKLAINEFITTYPKTKEAEELRSELAKWNSPAAAAVPPIL